MDDEVLISIYHLSSDFDDDEELWKKSYPCQVGFSQKDGFDSSETNYIETPLPARCDELYHPERDRIISPELISPKLIDEFLSYDGVDGLNKYAAADEVFDMYINAMGAMDDEYLDVYRVRFYGELSLILCHSDPFGRCTFVRYHSSKLNYEKASELASELFDLIVEERINLIPSSNHHVLIYLLSEVVNIYESGGYKNQYIRNSKHLPKRDFIRKLAGFFCLVDEKIKQKIIVTMMDRIFDGEKYDSENQVRRELKAYAKLSNYTPLVNISTDSIYLPGAKKIK